jgi:hypothetical protein
MLISSNFFWNFVATAHGTWCNWFYFFTSLTFFLTTHKTAYASNYMLIFFYTCRCCMLKLMPLLN